jgi:uncharacterized protein YciI
MFVVVLKYVKSLDEVDKRVKDHVAHVDRHFSAGRFLASGSRVPRTGGVILARGESIDEVRAAVEADPFVAEGLAEYEIFEFRPSRTEAGLEQLKT